MNVLRPAWFGGSLRGLLPPECARCRAGIDTGLPCCDRVCHREGPPRPPESTCPRWRHPHTPRASRGFRRGKYGDGDALCLVRLLGRLRRFGLQDSVGRGGRGRNGKERDRGPRRSENENNYFLVLECGSDTQIEASTRLSVGVTFYESGEEYLEL